MAEEDYQDYDDGDVFEWLYVEDDYALADELAEGQIPSPGYPGTAYEVDQAGYDLDLYEYFMDLEYGEDEYWNTGTIPTPGAEARRKRKRAPAKTPLAAVKRRRLSLQDTDGGNVRFLPMAARAKTLERSPSKRRPSFALLPDWRQRFASADGMLAEKEMPVEMKMAAESRMAETPPKGQRLGAMVTDVDKDEGDWVDEDEEDEPVLDGEDDLGADDDILRSLLMEKLKGTPLNGLDQGKLLQTVTQLLEGGGSEAALDDLTNALLGGQDEEEQKEVFGWLSGQGANLDVPEEEDDDEAYIGEAARPPRALNKDPVQSSPQDSAISSLRTSTADSSRQASLPFSSATKRKGLDEDGVGSTKKSKQGASNRSSEQFAKNVSELSLNEYRVADDEKVIPVAMAPNLADDSIAVANKQKTSAQGTGKNKNNSKSASTSVNVSQDELTTRGQADEGIDATDTIAMEPNPTRATSVKQSRKRKADTNDGLEEATSTQRKQPRRAAVEATTEIGPTTRRTRATRSKGGK